MTGDLDFAAAHWQHVDAALEWMRRYGDRDGDGLLEYQRDSDVGLVNQGWKDSNDSVRFRDARIAEPPIALIEVQGYALDARRRMAELATHLGRPEEAERLGTEAAALARFIHERYWLEDRAFFAEALDCHKERVDSLTSNPGNLLWGGPVPPIFQPEVIARAVLHVADHPTRELWVGRSAVKVILGQEVNQAYWISISGGWGTRPSRRISGYPSGARTTSTTRSPATGAPTATLTREPRAGARSSGFG